MHGLNRRHDAVEEELWINARCQSGEDEESSAALLCHGDRFEDRFSFTRMTGCRDAAIVTKERFLQGAQSKRSDEDHAGASNPNRERVRLPSPDKDGDFGSESAEPWNSHRCRGSDDKCECCEGQGP